MDVTAFDQVTNDVQVLQVGADSADLNLMRNLVCQTLRAEVRLANAGGARMLIRFPLRQPESDRG